MTSARSLDDWLRIQETVHGTGIDLTLERVREVAQRMRLLPPAARVITVAGTNGKGSTVACLAMLLRALGHRAGSFTSPHLVRYHERIRVDGADAADGELLAAFEAIEAARGDITLTFFEFNTLAALHVFAAREVEFAVLEVGLGGRLDAVNIVDAEAAIICSIGLDHADWLGTDIQVIGREKAGVFRSGALAVVADATIVPSVEAEAARIGARAVVAGRDYVWSRDEGQAHWRFTDCELVLRGLPLPALPGSRQLANASAALVTLHRMGLLDYTHAPQVARALSALQLPGRFQVVPGQVEWILDVAHNQAAAQTLAAGLAERPCQGRTLCVASMLSDKDIPAVAGALAGQVDAWFLGGIRAPRGLSAAELATRSPVFAGATLDADIPAAMRTAAAAARAGDRIVVCGSFLAVAPALEQLGLF